MAEHAAVISGTRNPLVVANFQKWWFASIAAGLGVGIQTVTVPLFIRDRVAEDNRAIVIALALAAQNLPGAVLALFGGVVADRVERRRILVRTYSVAALVSLTYVTLTGLDVAAVWPVFILGAVVGSAGAFTNPARQAMVPQMLEKPQIQNGVILGTMAFMASLQFAGPAVGGFVADAASLTASFAMEVVLLCVAALVFSRIATDRPVPSGRSVGRDLMDGLHYVKSHPYLIGLLALGAIPGVLLMGPFSVTIVLMVEDVFHESDKFVGFMWASFGAGILFGSVLLSLRPMPRRGLLFLLCVVVGSFGFILYGLSENTYLSMAILFVTGAVGPAVFINLGVALIQESVDANMMGRVMSMWGLVFSLSLPIGNLQAGIVTSLTSPQAAIVLSGVVALACGVVALLFLRPVRRID